MEILRKYGVQTDIYFPLIKAGSNDFALSADYTPAAGDTKISKDGGAAANTTNNPTAVAMGNGAMWKLTLTATEMQAAKIMIVVSDAATKAVEDQMLLVTTYGNASAEHAFDLDTANVAVGTNNDETGYTLSNAGIDAVFQRQMTEGYAADGTAPTLEQALHMILQTVNEFSISGTTLTVKKLDGTTTAMTITLDDANNPTSRTRTG